MIWSRRHRNICRFGQPRNNCVSSLFPMSASSYRSIGEFWGHRLRVIVNLELQNYPFGCSTNMSVAKALVMQWESVCVLCLYTATSKDAVCDTMMGCVKRDHNEITLANRILLRNITTPWTSPSIAFKLSSLSIQKEIVSSQNTIILKAIPMANQKNSTPSKIKRHLRKGFGRRQRKLEVSLLFWGETSYDACADS